MAYRVTARALDEAYENVRRFGFDFPQKMWVGCDDVMFLDCGLVDRFSFCQMNFLEQLLFTGFVVNPRFLAGHPRQTERVRFQEPMLGGLRLYTTSVSTR